MVIIFFFYIICFLLLWWGYFGYHLVLFVFSFINPLSKRNEEVQRYPTISILVPCYDEEEKINEKIENLSKLIYPKEKLEIVFVDGGSTDATVPRIETAIHDNPWMRLVKTEKKDKIAQINCVLGDVRGEIVISTDVDSSFKENVLIEIVKEFQSDSKIGVVGGLVIPESSLPVENRYWEAQNQARILESRVYSSSIVIAPCYAFKKGFIESFPEDVVADDIYLPFLANLKGYRVLYSPNVIVRETRVPDTLPKLFRHKLRKANAYITEVLRFFYHLPKLNLFWRIMFITRFLQVIGLPWLLLIFGMLTISLIQFRQYELILWFGATGLFSLLLTHILLSTIRIPGTKMGSSIFLTAKSFVMTNCVLIVAGLTYPFYKQTGSYQKTG